LLLLVTAPSRGDEPKPLSYWEPGDARPFVSTRVDASVNFAKGLVAVGYGKPHWMWIGAEGFALSTTEFGGFYGGVRASTPILDIAYGVRDNFSYFHGYLDPADHHTSDEVRAQSTKHQRYLATELEISGLVPLLGGYALWALNADKILDGPANVHIYEESMRVVARTWLIGTRLGYVYPIGPGGVIKAGVVGEYVILPERPGNVVRLGPAVVVTITEHLELLGILSVPVSSPDSLGVVVGSWGVGSLRYKWATGEKHPQFP
jgi:hypothetical protein